MEKRSEILGLLALCSTLQHAFMNPKTQARQEGKKGKTHTILDRFEAGRPSFCWVRRLGKENWDRFYPVGSSSPVLQAPGQYKPPSHLRAVPKIDLW